MTIEYSLQKEDFLTYQLYTASNSEQVQKKRRRNRLLVPLVYVILAFALYMVESTVLAIVFLVFAALWLFFYPRYGRRRYEKHFDKFIDEHYQNRLGKTGTISLEEDHILMKDYTGESKIKLEAIEAIDEIQHYYFIRFSSGVSLILPKRRIANLEEVEPAITDLVQKLQIPHQVNLDWKWE